MSRYDEEERTAYYRRVVERTSGQGSLGVRHIDGTTRVSSADLLSARERILATAKNSPGNLVVAGLSASILHGTKWFEPEFKVELLHALTGSSWQGTGRTTHRYQLSPEDVTEVDGVRVTTPVRTAFDVGRIPPEWRGLGNLDALHRASGFSLPALFRYIDEHRGWRFIRQLRAIAPLVDGSAESPPESWVRLLIVRGDLPMPETQIVVADETGYEFARVDLGYRARKIAIEYDGKDFHSSDKQREHDAHRDAKLRELGWEPVRIDSKRLFEEPWTILTEIEKLLHARGAY